MAILFVPTCPSIIISWLERPSEASFSTSDSRPTAGPIVFPLDRNKSVTLEQHIALYNLNQYLTQSTKFQYCHILLDGDYLIKFSFRENYQEVYIFLWQAVSQYVENCGKNTVILELPIRAEDWITVQERYKQEAEGPPTKFRLI